MCISFTNIYNENINQCNYTYGFPTSRRLIIPERTQIDYMDHEIYIANLNPIHLHSMNSNYLHTLDETLRQYKERHPNYVVINHDDIQYLIWTIFSLYGIYYFVNKIINCVYEQ